jgi:hypothetical protein
MQKVVGSSPIIRFGKSPAQAGLSVFKETTQERRVSPVSALAERDRDLAEPLTQVAAQLGHSRKSLTLDT